MGWSVIFDMNGVLIDDMGYHIQAWRTYRRRIEEKLPLQRTQHDLTGRTNREIFSILLGREVNLEESERLEVKKEALYRQIYTPHLKALPGLTRLLQNLKTDSVPVALATSGPPANVDFILDGLEIRTYFDAIVDASQISHGKPHPEVFLTAAGKLGLPPGNCVVFEDSLLGIEAARRAGMAVIGITTTLPAEELQGTVLAVADFERITLDRLKAIALQR